MDYLEDIKERVNSGEWDSAEKSKIAICKLLEEHCNYYKLDGEKIIIDDVVFKIGKNLNLIDGDGSLIDVMHFLGY